MFKVLFMGKWGELAALNNLCDANFDLVAVNLEFFTRTFGNKLDGGPIRVNIHREFSNLEPYRT